MPRRRGAVVVGVNKTGGGLPVLEGSAAGAKAFGMWLTSEGFEVKLITDSEGPVEWEQIRDAVKSFVDPQNYDQLVIYFSGHGYWKNDTELWLLTDAPGDANAAVSWVETAEFAKDCGIPNVVMISDACRSIPDSPRALKVRGSIVFPNEEATRTRAKIDKFAAATIGSSAYELPLDATGKKQNVFTHCFLRAFAAPDDDMVRDVNEEGQVFRVVPNRKLGKYIQREVITLLGNYNVQLSQLPDAEVLSDDDAYIGRAPTRSRGRGDIAETLDAGEFTTKQPGRAPSEPVVHLRDVAELAFRRALNEQPQVSSAEILAIEELAKRSGFDEAVAQAKIVSNVSHFETETGFAILGVGVKDALVANGESPIIRSHGDGINPAVVRIEQHLAPACTVVLQFTTGHGTALAALHGFIGHVLVDGDRVMNVSYVPSDNSKRWADYSDRKQRIEDLRAAATAAARLGVFRLDNKKRAVKLAEDIRVFKGLDPSLGLYSAYAYAEADRRDDVNSVLHYMRDDLGADLFDVAMLARNILGAGREPIVPFCPMLTQGWNFLRARAITLPQVLNDAQDDLTPGLWTTFKPMRTQLILEAIRSKQIG